MNLDKYFLDIVTIIQNARTRALRSVNIELISIYWQVGEYVSNKIQLETWGSNTIEKLAYFIKSNEPDIKGFSAQNIWRMKQFYEMYKDNEFLSPLVTEISWTHNRLIMSKTKTDEERKFYLNLTIKEKYSKRELERQLDSCLYERKILSKPKLSKKLIDTHPNADNVFNDQYMFDFLHIKDDYLESDFQKSIINNLKEFILEIGKDFIFIGEEYRLQVGNHDYFIDLLFFHRELQCLVVFELKINEFKPEYLGKLEFYLEALDKTVKKSHENPSIGVLLCKTKDDVVVEFSLNRSLSPAVVSEYKTKLIDKNVLHDKMNILLHNEN